MGPDSSPSFDAPTLATESYQKNIPNAIKADAGIRSFQSRKTEIDSFLAVVAEIASRAAPAIMMLFPAMASGANASRVERSSIEMDSAESRIA
jgi:hypothetical protein